MGMTNTYTYTTTDGDYGDPREATLEASGIGEAAQLAYTIATDNDRWCVSVAEVR